MSRLTVSLLSILIGVEIVPPGQAQNIPNRLRVCEVDHCDGRWTFSGKQGRGEYDHGAEAVLTIESFNGKRILVRRKDIAGVGLGVTATYSGTLEGNRFEGDMTWEWPGHYPGPHAAKWSATIESLEDAPTSPATGVDLTGIWMIPNTKEFKRIVQRGNRFELSPLKTNRPELEGKILYTGVISGYNIISKGLVAGTQNDWRDESGLIQDQDHLLLSGDLALIRVTESSPENLAGTWVSPGIPGKFRIKTNGNKIENTYWSVNNPKVSGLTIFRGELQGDRMVGQVLDIASGQWSEVKFTVKTGDYFVSDQGLKVFRSYEPILDRAACDLRNPSHVDGLAALLKGMNHLHGDDPVVGKCWLEVAAAQNQARAQSILGDMFFNGIGTEKDVNRAFVLLQRSAEQGDYYGEYGLAACYKDGVGVPADPKQSQNWLAKANSHLPPELRVADRRPMGTNDFLALFAVDMLGGAMNDTCTGPVRDYMRENRFVSESRARYLLYHNLPNGEPCSLNDKNGNPR